MIRSDELSSQTFSGSTTADYTAHSQTNITEIGLILDPQSVCLQTCWLGVEIGLSSFLTTAHFQGAIPTVLKPVCTCCT